MLLCKPSRLHFYLSIFILLQDCFPCSSAHVQHWCTSPLTLQDCFPYSSANVQHWCTAPLPKSGNIIIGSMLLCKPCRHHHYVSITATAGLLFIQGFDCPTLMHSGTAQSRKCAFWLNAALQTMQTAPYCQPSLTCAHLLFTQVCYCPTLVYSTHGQRREHTSWLKA